MTPTPSPSASPWANIDGAGEHTCDVCKTGPHQILVAWEEMCLCPGCDKAERAAQIAEGFMVPGSGDLPPQAALVERVEGSAWEKTSHQSPDPLAIVGSMFVRPRSGVWQFTDHDLMRLIRALQPSSAADAKPVARDAERDRLFDAYVAGATNVHEYWTENPGEAPRGDPEFDEAANDYAASVIDAAHGYAKRTVDAAPVPVPGPDRNCWVTPEMAAAAKSAQPHPSQQAGTEDLLEMLRDMYHLTCTADDAWTEEDLNRRDEVMSVLQRHPHPEIAALQHGEAG